MAGFLDRLSYSVENRQTQESKLALKDSDKKYRDIISIYITMLSYRMTVCSII